jgi:hypothetical protein
MGHVWLAQVDPVTMGRSLWWLVEFWIRAILILLGCFAVFMAVRMLEWRRLKRKTEREAAQAKLGPDGKPLPPVAGGMCDCCGQAFDSVYYLPQGGRRCPACYQKDQS